MRNVLETIIWKNYWGRISAFSLLETVTKKKVCRLLVLLWRSCSWALYNCRVFKVPGILGNTNCLWYQLVLVFQWCHTIYRSTQWISCLWTCRGVQIVLEKHLKRERVFSEALILRTSDNLTIHSLIFWVWIQLF